MEFLKSQRIQFFASQIKWILVQQAKLFTEKGCKRILERWRICKDTLCPIHLSTAFHIRDDMKQMSNKWETDSSPVKKNMQHLSYADAIIPLFANWSRVGSLSDFQHIMEIRCVTIALLQPSSP